MKNEKGKKGQLTARNPEQSWQAIEELVRNDEGMTVEELDQELRAFGVDPDESVRRLFELAREISRDPNPSGQVSSHISDILNQLAPKYFHQGSKAATVSGQACGSSNHSSSESTDVLPSEEAPKPKAAVASFHRNYKNKSAKDRAIREIN
jgi:hypothetical protein